MVKICKVSSNLGTVWDMVITDKVSGRHIASYRHTEQDIDKAIRQLRYAINKHLRNGGTIGNYQW